MEAVTIAQTPGELYNSILIDTPLSEFFNGFSEADLDEMNIEIIRNTLYKVAFLALSSNQVALVELDRGVLQAVQGYRRLHGGDNVPHPRIRSRPKSVFDHDQLFRNRADKRRTREALPRVRNPLSLRFGSFSII